MAKPKQILWKTSFFFILLKDMHNNWWNLHTGYVNNEWLNKKWHRMREEKADEWKKKKKAYTTVPGHLCAIFMRLRINWWVLFFLYSSFFFSRVDNFLIYLSVVPFLLSVYHSGSGCCLHFVCLHSRYWTVFRSFTLHMSCDSQTEIRQSVIY